MYGRNAYAKSKSTLSLHGYSILRVKWNEAQEKCQTAGGNLASFPTSYSNSFVFAQSLTYAESGLWIGLHAQLQGSKIPAKLHFSI